MDAYNFIFERCNKDLATSACVAISLSALLQEYERGEHKKIEDFDFGKIALQNEVALATDGRADISIGLPDALFKVAEANKALISELALKFGPMIKEACNGDRALASVVATMAANVAYYDDDSVGAA